MPENTHFRRIRSFVRREGRLTKGQQHALDRLLPIYGLKPQADQLLCAQDIFQRHAPLHLEIGFGNGHALTSMAATHPQNDYIGIEVHRPGVGNALIHIEQQQLNNVRVICEDAVEVLKQHIQPASLDAVYIFFPDPWHKRRHHKRRLVQVAFIEMLATRLKAGAIIHLATDWKEYAQHMLSVMRQVNGFKNLADHDGYSEKPDYRPLTKFEQRGLRLGHGVWDLVFQKLAE